MNSALTVSIVTPSFQQARFLEATIQSVLTQDHPRVEYLVIDGGSTDGSRAIIDRYASQLSYSCSRPDGGQADAIAAGFSRATGDILGWLNSDDLFLPGALSAVASYFATHPEIDVLSGGGYMIDQFGKPLTKRFGTVTRGVRASLSRLRFYALDGVFQPATFWRCSAYQRVGGIDRRLRFVMDRDLFIRLARHGRWGRLPRLLAAFRLHSESKSMTLQDVREQETTLLASRYGMSNCPPLVRRAFYWRYRLPSLGRKLWLGLQGLRVES
jgi:glycosyltransferase involved in cell wall biosynthesis